MDVINIVEVENEEEFVLSHAEIDKNELISPGEEHQDKYKPWE